MPPCAGARGACCRSGRGPSRRRPSSRTGRGPRHEGTSGYRGLLHGERSKGCRMLGSTARPPRRLVALFAITTVVFLASCGDDDGADSATGAGTGEPTVREELAETAPANAPGQRLYLQRVTINPGARLDTHYHDGTQVAAVVDGTLTYDMVEGAVEVTRKDGTVETFTAPETISLDEGDAITETVE